MRTQRHLHLVPTLVEQLPVTTPSAVAQGDISGDAAQDGCTECGAWGRDTCTAILASSSIASWGGILMAPLLAIDVAMSLLLSQRIAAQKQALAQIISECRQDVSLAYRALQAKGRVSGISVEDLKSALATMWETNDSETQARAPAVLFQQLRGAATPAGGLCCAVASQAVCYLPRSGRPRAMHGSLKCSCGCSMLLSA